MNTATGPACPKPAKDWSHPQPIIDGGGAHVTPPLPSERIDSAGGEGGIFFFAVHPLENPLGSIVYFHVHDHIQSSG